MQYIIRKTDQYRHSTIILSFKEITKEPACPKNLQLMFGQTLYVRGAF